jgi:hypothetical protein
VELGGGHLDALLPVEIGMHLLRAVPKGQKGRGKHGGLSEYAKRMDKPRTTLIGWMNAAEVLEAAKLSPGDGFLSDKVKHLEAIHKAPREAWRPLVERMAQKEADGKDQRTRRARAGRSGEQRRSPR